jgi:hypothetical protein
MDREDRYAAVVFGALKWSVLSDLDKPLSWMPEWIKCCFWFQAECADAMS